MPCGRRKQIPSDSLLQLRQRLEHLSLKSPERASQIAAMGNLYGVSPTTVYRALRTVSDRTRRIAPIMANRASCRPRNWNDTASSSPRSSYAPPTRTAGTCPPSAPSSLHGSGPLTRYSFGPYPHFFMSLGFAVVIYDKPGHRRLNWNALGCFHRCPDAAARRVLS